MSYEYSDRHSKYRNFSVEEWNLKNSFSYDDHFGFSDLKIFDMQNNHRFYSQLKDFGLPWDSSSFCTAFSENSRRNRLIQRHLCQNLCFWDPQQCFLENSHSGNLADLMHKDFHDGFSPSFQKQFERNYSSKIDWSPTGGPGLYYPTIGLKKLIEELGITTKLTYDGDKYAVNFDNLKREFRDSIPVRPLYVMEEKKCQDVIEAAININREKIEKGRIEKEKLFDESYRGNGGIQKPILSIMMWGPYADSGLQKTDQECKLENVKSGSHVCTNFSEKHYWMHSHNAKVPCKMGPIENLEGPAMTSDLKVIYPCNRAGCNEDCLCDLCVSSLKCPRNDHKEHLKQLNSECSVAKEFQCQDHDIDHPENFNEKEDILVEKNIFYHNLKLVDQPREHSTGQIKFAGIKKICKVCCLNVKNHFKHHKVIHLQCKYCLYQLKTAFDKNFWDKVCSTCGKIVSSIKKLKYWHKKIHSTHWSCDECDVNFNRKWTLRRHLVEIHAMTLHEIDHDSEEEYSEDDLNSTDTESDDHTDFESSDTEVDRSKVAKCSTNKLQCEYCGKEFSVKRYLDAHVKVTHTEKQSFKCDECDKSFTQPKHLKRHSDTVHGHCKSDHVNLTGEKKTNTCDICGTNFTRIDNLNEHIKRAHSLQSEKFTCSLCGKKFDRKWNMKCHEKKCTVSNPNILVK